MTKIKVIIIFGLRLIALAASVVTTIVMGTAHDSATILNFKFEAKFSNSPAFKYYVIIYGIVSCYSLAILLLPYKNLLWRLILVLDTVVTLMLSTAVSSALSIAYVGKKGNTNAGWLPICGQVPKFCDETTAALVVGFVALILYLLILLYSLYAALSPFFSVNS
ncbi:CASP-like protein 1C2 [Amaranthus tricolor]|uniref:CASP-like protein 1C2 n=1 Tax=Amaranthus tricolor TaxID=29722 RepID=UPI0025865760|nr:CASP-like protein 1C2 [Amaranthus tricolor]